MSLRILVYAVIAALLALLAIYAFDELFASIGFGWSFLILFIIFLILLNSSQQLMGY